MRPPPPLAAAPGPPGTHAHVSSPTKLELCLDTEQSPIQHRGSWKKGVGWGSVSPRGQHDTEYVITGTDVSGGGGGSS